MTPTELTTPETYLGYDHQLANYVGSRPRPDRAQDYHAPKDVTQNDWALSGRWRLGPEHTTAGRNAGLAPHFHPEGACPVMVGRGPLGASADGPERRPSR